LVDEAGLNHVIALHILKDILGMCKIESHHIGSLPLERKHAISSKAVSCRHEEKTSLLISSVTFKCGNTLNRWAGSILKGSDSLIYHLYCHCFLSNPNFIDVYYFNVLHA
jgi:hypothetical protein